MPFVANFVEEWTKCSAEKVTKPLMEEGIDKARDKVGDKESRILGH